jgi:DNA-directed RNA polymerase subunit E'/Rpb7
VEQVRFRVRTLNFNKSQSSKSASQAIGDTVIENSAAVATRRGVADVQSEEPAAMQITACVNEDGLGNVLWWIST